MYRNPNLSDHDSLTNTITVDCAGGHGNTNVYGVQERHSRASRGWRDFAEQHLWPFREQLGLYTTFAKAAERSTYQDVCPDGRQCNENDCTLHPHYIRCTSGVDGRIWLWQECCGFFLGHISWHSSFHPRCTWWPGGGGCGGVCFWGCCQCIWPSRWRRVDLSGWGQYCQLCRSLPRACLWSLHAWHQAARESPNICSLQSISLEEQVSWNQWFGLEPTWSQLMQLIFTA